MQARTLALQSPVATAPGTDLVGEIMVELPKITLASASPRRAEILRTVGWPFETLPVNIDESRRDNEDAVGYVQRLAGEKAEAAAQKARHQLIVAADTTVVIDGHILEKPIDEN